MNHIKWGLFPALYGMNKDAGLSKYAFISHVDSNRLTASPDFLALVLKVRPLSGGIPVKRLPGWWGRAVQKLFLDAISRQDYDLAEETHGSIDGVSLQSNLRGYTVSSLVGFEPSAPFHEGKYWLRMTSLNQELSEALLSEAETGLLKQGSKIELDHIPFQVEQAIWTHEAHPWAGACSWQSVFEIAYRSNAALPDRVKLRFASPVFFKTAGEFEFMPYPDLVFGNLQEKWTSFVPQMQLSGDAKMLAGAAMRFDRFVNFNTQSVETRRVRNRSVYRIGSTGTVTYRLEKIHRDDLRLLYLLGLFSFFSGVGKETTIGLGRVKLL
ncbi:CRISPR system precrRNA processing endoribonuclease RAMP protein Cas6 [bacterium]|nr:CRISPR system precrRNA processing endoribonuclease RAMP protein Cas6 [bacterium]